MSLDELKARRTLLKQNSDITLNNMQKIADESIRVADVAHNSKQILEDLDREFEACTGLTGTDIKFLFTAVGLQLARIAIVNELTRTENAGKGNKKEGSLHDLQDRIFEKFKKDTVLKDRPYYSSLEHIISTHNVPYDTTKFLTEKTYQTLLNKPKKDYSWDFDISKFMLTEKLPLFKGDGNHRFVTLGHDPVIGLIFGTANIMTNTITCVKHPDIGIPIITTNHVIFTSDYKEPSIGKYASTSKMLKIVANRTTEEPTALVAALIKQIIHIGTDIYTTCGINIPGASLILDNKGVKELTERISAGDLLKIGTSASLANLINTIISTIHALMYDSSMPVNKDVYGVRTRKIIMYSNVIASCSNVLWTGAQMYAGKENAIRQLDIGGLLVTLKRLRTDSEYIRRIKEEFVFGNFNQLIQGEPLELEDITWD